MKKMTAVVLVLGLTMPAHSWILFPVREKVVIETKTNYAVTAVACAITLLAGIGYMWHKNKQLQDDNDYVRDNIVTKQIQIQQLQEDIRNLTDTLHTNQQALVAANVQNTRNEAEIKGLRQNIAALTSQRSELGESVDEKRVEIDALRAEAQKKQQENERISRSMSAKMEKLTNKVTALETQLQKATDACRKSGKDRATALADVATLQARLTQMKLSMGKLQSTNTALRTIIDRMQDNVQAPLTTTDTEQPQPETH
jgi:chromosome segregation ATPase